MTPTPDPSTSAPAPLYLGVDERERRLLAPQCLLGLVGHALLERLASNVPAQVQPQTYGPRHGLVDVLTAIPHRQACEQSMTNSTASAQHGNVQ